MVDIDEAVETLKFAVTAFSSSDDKTRLAKIRLEEGPEGWTVVAFDQEDEPLLSVEGSQSLEESLRVALIKAKQMLGPKLSALTIADNRIARVLIPVKEPS